jgi:hypothetical protein
MCRRLSGIRAGIALALLMAISAGCRGKSSAPAAAGTIPLDERLGWVNGSCLAMMNQVVPGDTAVTVVALDGSPAVVTGKIVTGKIVAATQSPDICAPLLADRRGSNDMWSFYQVRLDRHVDLGIGVTGDVVAVDGGLDLTGDGKAEQFTQCSTAEGVSFGVWAGPPYRGAPAWSGYYYLGYDTEADCPS